MRVFFLAAFITAIAASTSYSQGFYSMSNGSYMTGYGQVNGTFGYAMAVQNSYQSMQMIMMKSRNCQSMEKQFGRAKTLQAAPYCSNYLKGAKSSAPAAAATTTSPRSTTPAAANVASAPKYVGRFRPDPSFSMSKTIADSLSTDPNEQSQLVKILDTVKSSYDAEAKAHGWSNNAAGGMAFFIASLTAVYKDKDDMTDEQQNMLFDAINQTFDASPDLAKASDREKQQLNDMLVGFAALPLATYVDAKQRGDAAQLETSKKLAGAIFEMVFKAKPE